MTTTRRSFVSSFFILSLEAGAINRNTPDLQLSSWGHPGSAVQGESVTVTASIENNGSDPAEARAEIAIETFDQAGKERIGVSDSHIIDPATEYRFEFETEQLNFEPGDHELLFTAHRYDEDQNDWIYVDNGTSQDITIEQASPDLRLYGWAHPGSAVQGESVTVDASIENNGSASAETRAEIAMETFDQAGKERIGVSDSHIIDPGADHLFEFETEQLNFEPGNHEILFTAHRYDEDQNDWIHVDSGTNQDFTIEQTNADPVADAGPDRSVDEETTVELEATGSEDPDGDSLSYMWEQIDGTLVDLVDSNTATPEFTAPAVDEPQQLQFKLTASDGNGGTDTDSLEVIVSPVNESPIAVAGPNRTVSEGKQVQLDASASTDPDDDQLTYSWEQISGPSVDLSSSTTDRPMFTAPEVEEITTLTFEVTVTDRNGGSDTDQVEIQVEPVNHSPTADAGSDRTVDAGETLQLDGSGSTDPDNDSLNYSWEQISGPSVDIQNGESVTPTIQLPSVETERRLLFELTVRDGMGDADSDIIGITITPATTTNSEVSTDSTANSVDTSPLSKSDDAPLTQANEGKHKESKSTDQTETSESGEIIELPAPPWTISAGGTLATVYFVRRFLTGDDSDGEVDSGKGHPKIRDEMEDEDMVEEINERYPDE